MENITTSLSGYRMDAELKNVPIGFVNALRRICLSELPVVVISNIEILENNTQLTHEMVRHRVSMLPVNVRPEETGVIRDTRIELRFMPQPSVREITTDDFVVAGPRKDVLLKDRDLDTPLYFMKLKENESIHIKTNLSIEPKGSSQVCVSTFKNHIDPDKARLDKDTWIAQGGDPREFDNFHIQRSYARDENGRPNHFDFRIESIGVVPAKDIFKRGVEILKSKIEEFLKVPIEREGSDGWYTVKMEGETYTLGQLTQELIYSGGLVEFVSRDCGHPLVPILTIRFQTKLQPEAVLERFKQEAYALCESVLNSV
jgi:DNA-directed RNA polymerase alpha subunit